MRITRFSVGITVFFVILTTMFVLFIIGILSVNVIKTTTIIGEGIIEGMYIDSSVGMNRAYFVVIAGKALEVSKGAYNLLQIGDIIRVFADGNVVIL